MEGDAVVAKGGGGERGLTPAAALALAKAQQYRDIADSEATRRAYAADVARYREWCLRVGLQDFPATPEVVGAYLAHLGGNYARATLRRRVAAISRETALRGAPLDTKHPAIRETLRGVAQKHGNRGRRATAMTTIDVRRMVEGCDLGLVGRRDRALLLLGFAAALRRSELAALEVAHVRWTRTGAVLLIERSKTDDERKGQEVSIARGQAEGTCPVRALRAWLGAAGITSGPLFRKVGRGGKVWARALSGDGVRQIVRRRAEAAGLTAEAGEFIGPHGLRAGFVTTAYANGVPDEEIMAQTRHRSLGTMRGYVRRAKLAGGSPSAKLGL